jgi:hypothetical protein
VHENARDLSSYSPRASRTNPALAILVGPGHGSGASLPSES